MTICTPEGPVIPRPPPLLIRTGNLKASLKGSARGSMRSNRSGSSKGFRLVDEADTGSVYSVYKQKIDSMFESDSSGNASNTVQARIERMFSEVARDEGIRTETGCHTFSIDYLGSVPLKEKVTSLTGLQTPLKELYFAYKKSSRHKSTMTGRLEISQSGLRVQYQGEKGDLEQMNPFPTIAVWSAVKFVLHDTPKKYAFLPLITDPDNIDKQTLFRDLEDEASKYIVNQTHAPLFAVVMRKIGVHKQLECHGFVCQTSEDAIVIAATLYKSLMNHMKSKDKKPKNRNGVSCISMTSSVYNESPSQVPIRPPRKKRSTTSSVISGSASNNDKPKKSTKTRKAPTVPLPKEDIDAILPYEEPIDPKDEKKSDNELTRTRSVRKRTEEGLTKSESGDILTKVTIPRSGSFLNAGGLTRYKSKANRLNGQASGGSPLGFNELFNEFRLQEGLNSMDEILGVIIDSEGMSFNDLKPIYKEFLLKLAVTLTKDELYQRSKSIMRRQKKKIMRKNSSAQKQRRKIIIGAKGLKRVFRKSFRMNLTKKLYQKKPSPKPFEPKKLSVPNVQESSISSSSYDTHQFRPKQPVARKQSYRKSKNDIKEANMRMRRERMSTSEDSDFFTLKRSKAKTSPSNQNRNSSSGYVSCSECSYDSDTCTCVSADKCYCSLGNKVERKGNKYSDDGCYCNERNMTWCGCDTDSCTDSNKCYCQSFNPKGSIFEQLKRRGFIPTSQLVETPPNERKLCKKYSNTRSTKSVEYMPNPSEKYYEKFRAKPPPVAERFPSEGCKRNTSSENLGLDYNLFNSQRQFPKAMSELVTRNYSSQNSIRSFKSYSSSKRAAKALQTTVPANSSNEALSVKKSAEIAALFTDIKLSQTTDISHVVPPNHRHKTEKRTVAAPYKHTTNTKLFQPPYLQRSLSGSKSGMYSAKNGLYTIQSQSDSSSSENKQEKVYSLNPKGDGFANSRKSATSLESTLGYLP